MYCTRPATTRNRLSLSCRSAHAAMAPTGFWSVRCGAAGSHARPGRETGRRRPTSGSPAPRPTAVAEQDRGPVHHSARLRPRLHRSPQPPRRGQHDPPLHHLAEQARPGQAATPTRRRGGRSLTRYQRSCGSTASPRTPPAASPWCRLDLPTYLPTYLPSSEAALPSALGRRLSQPTTVAATERSVPHTEQRSVRYHVEVEITFDIVGLSPLLGAVALLFYVEVIRGRPFFGRAIRSTSLARAFLFSGLAIFQIESPQTAGVAISIALLVLAVIFFLAALCIWGWQGWSGRSAKSEQHLATPSGT